MPDASQAQISCLSVTETENFPEVNDSEKKKPKNHQMLVTG